MDRPKVGLITYCVGNQGSALQCYATQQYLLKNGLDCCLYTRHETGVDRILQSFEYRLGAFLKLLRYPKYKNVYKECLTFEPSGGAMTEATKNRINQFACEFVKSEKSSWKGLKRISNSKECIFFLSGSDQIWSGRWFFTNRIWFLRFCPKRKRIAWMPSFGSDSISEYNKDIYSRYISEYKFISVRENTGQQIVKELTGKEAPVLPDPVYLLDASEWRLISDCNKRKSNYILMFFISKPSEIALNYAKKRAEELNGEIVWLSYDHKANGIFVDGGPKEFISYIDGADTVLTDSFHASLFSIILSSSFFVFRRTDTEGSKQLGRVHNLLKKFDMQNRLVEDNLPIDNLELDEKKISAVLEEEKSKVDIYLKNILDYYLQG